MARPRKYSDKEIIAALKKTGGMVFLAAKRVGCDSNTIYERSKVSKEISGIIHQERGALIDTAESKLLAAIKKGESWAVQFALRTLGRHRGYSENVETTPPPPSAGSLPIELATEFAEFLAARRVAAALAAGGSVPGSLSANVPVVPDRGAAEPGVSQPSG
jgi:hypothetical protein